MELEEGHSVYSPVYWVNALTVLGMEWDENTDCGVGKATVMAAQLILSSTC